MIKSLGLVIFLLQPSTMCKGSRVVLESTPSPCTGILISEEQSRKALTCLRVDLPQLRADLKLTEAKASAELDAMRTQLAVTRTIIESQEPAPPWLFALSVAGALVVGVLAGGFTVGALK